MTYIRKPGTSLYLAISIDSGGMSVDWVPFEHASGFPTPTAAKSFVDSRFKERYPNEEMMLETMS